MSKINNNLLMRVCFIAVVSLAVYYLIFFDASTPALVSIPGRDGVIGHTMPPVACISTPEGEPIITSLSSRSGPVETRLEIRGCNLAGFEGDKNVWIENDRAVRGLLRPEQGSPRNSLS